MTDTAILDVEQIKQLLPHRAPMLMVEKLADIVPRESATGYKAVSINDPFFMGGGETARCLQGVIQRLAGRQRHAAQLFAQGFTGQQLRDDVRRAVLRADVVNGQDVRMVERGSCARFLLEATQPVSISREGRWQNFDRDFAVEACIARAVHFTHPARAKEGENPVRAKTGIRCKHRQT